MPLTVHQQNEARLQLICCAVPPALHHRPTFYVSHTWGASVKLLVETVEAHLASAGDQARVWVDWVAVRQGSGAGREEDLAGVAQVIGACSGGTLVAADIRKVNPATRAW